jgi:hypothetical protein
VIRFLLRLYPAAWRKEYGEEFAEVLQSRRLSLRIVADVLASAAWQRLRHAPLWIVVGVCLMVTNIGGMLMHFLGSLPWQGLRYLDPFESLAIFLTAVWMASRKDSSFVSGVWATMKAMLICASPGLAATLIALAMSLLQPSAVFGVFILVFRRGVFVSASGALCGTVIRRLKGRFA